MNKQLFIGLLSFFAFAKKAIVQTDDCLQGCHNISLHIKRGRTLISVDKPFTEDGKMFGFYQFSQRDDKNYLVFEKVNDPGHNIPVHNLRIPEWGMVIIFSLLYKETN